MDFLKISGKKFLVFGVANKKSVAYFITKTIIEAGAEAILSVENEEVKDRVEKLFPGSSVFTCDIQKTQNIIDLRKNIGEGTIFDGIVHSVAYANYSEGFSSFHETKKDDFLKAVNISCFSLINISNVFRDSISGEGSVVTISISTTRMAAENYGYMSPIKAALDSSVCFLAKSFSAFSKIRFNAVCAGLLKTSSSAGIPGYVDSYLYAEKATLRKENLKTQEVADTVVYLLSPRSSGINARRIVVDAGMSINYFDREIVRSATK